MANFENISPPKSVTFEMGHNNGPIPKITEGLSKWQVYEVTYFSNWPKIEVTRRWSELLSMWLISEMNYKL